MFLSEQTMYKSSSVFDVLYNTNFLRNNFMQNEKNDKKEEVMKINILFRT